MAVFDVETTGVDPLEARMCQAALLVVEPDDTVRPGGMAGLICPGVDIPEGAAKVHGISTERSRKGTPIAAATAKIVASLQSWDGYAHGVPLLMFNAGYDWRVLRAEAKRQSLTLLDQVHILDPLVIDRKLDKYRKGKRTLGTQYAHYVGGTFDAHDAKADCVATVRVMRAIIKKYPELRRESLEGLMLLQRRWYAEWRDHINEYWAEKGVKDERTGEVKRIVDDWLS